MSTLYDLWKKLSKKKYREAFVASQLKRGIPFQIRSLRNKRGWSQKDLAKSSALTQGVISRAEDSDYGNLTFNTILRIAAGFDVAFIGKFVPFSELGGWFMNLSEESVQVASFTDEKIETPKERTVGTAIAAGIQEQSPWGVDLTCSVASASVVGNTLAATVVNMEHTLLSIAVGTTFFTGAASGVTVPTANPDFSELKTPIVDPAKKAGVGSLPHYFLKLPTKGIPVWQNRQE